jgi:hypothetical protein
MSILEGLEEIRQYQKLIIEGTVIPNDIFKISKTLKSQLDRLEKLVKSDKLPQKTFSSVFTYLNNANKNLTKIIGS